MGITTTARLGLGALLLVASATALAENAMTNDATSLYAGPDGSYPVVAQLHPDTPIQVMGCLDDWSWCDVVVEGARGWLYSPDIVYAYQDGYVPLYSYAPALGIAVEPFVIDVYWGHYYHDRPWYPRREEWAHREIHHRRPSGPPPSASLPPRPEHREAGRPGDGIRLGSAEAQRREADRRDAERRDAERRNAERGGAAGDNRNFAPPQQQQPRRAEPHPMSPPAPRPQREAPEAPRGAPPAHEDRTRPNPPNPVPRAAEPRHEDHARPEERTPPRKREDNPH